MIGYYLAVATLATLNLISIALVLWLFGRLRRVEAILEPRGESAAPSTSPAVAQGSPAPFAAKLLGSEMERKFKEGAALREPPEKYGFIAGLAEQGMSPQEIARVLHLSPGEVQQTLSLSRLSQPEEKR